MAYISKLEKIGEGTYGTVFKAKDCRSGEILALKRVCMDEEGVASTILREIALLKTLQHPNIIALKDVSINEVRAYLLFEYFPMDLRYYMGNLPTEMLLDADLIRNSLYQIVSAISFCHSRRILHRDLKPQNILIDKKGTIKVADFGLSRAFQLPVHVLTHEIATLYYRSPEVLMSTKYSCPVDVWSIGCIFAEMHIKEPIFQGDSEISQLFKIFETLGTPDDIIWPGFSSLHNYSVEFPKWTVNILDKQINNINDVALNLLKKMLIYDPIMRISAQESLSHEYFNNFQLKIFNLF